jgi:hypothetical protein
MTHTRDDSTPQRGVFTTVRHAGLSTQTEEECAPEAAHLSPSMDLKSLTMAMPSPASEYSTVSTVTSHRSSPNSACAVQHHTQLYVTCKFTASLIFLQLKYFLPDP